jgi:hypothetical protein
LEATVHILWVNADIRQKLGDLLAPNERRRENQPSARVQSSNNSSTENFREISFWRKL